MEIVLSWRMSLKVLKDTGAEFTFDVSFRRGHEPLTTLRSYVPLYLKHKPGLKTMFVGFVFQGKTYAFYSARLHAGN